MIGIRTPKRIRLAVTRLVSSGPLPTRTAPFKQNPFFTVQLYLRPTSGAKLWHGNREISVDSQRHDGSVTTHNFEQEPSVYLGSSFDILQFYVPRDALDEFADENEFRRCEGLVWPHGKVDPTFKSLALSIMPALEEPELSSQIYMDYLILATHSYIARNYGGMVRATKAPPGGLAHWQKQRATELLRANPDGDVSLHDISRECRLSPSRFAHAFKESFGLPPHRWLIEKRVEIAKDLLRKSELPIIDVALRSGFPDQTTFYRAFRRSASMSPSEWRRR